MAALDDAPSPDKVTARWEEVLDEAWITTEAKVKCSGIANLFIDCSIVLLVYCSLQGGGLLWLTM